MSSPSRYSPLTGSRSTKPAASRSASSRDAVDRPCPVTLATSETRSSDRPAASARSTLRPRSTLWLLPVSAAIEGLSGSCLRDTARYTACCMRSTVWRECRVRIERVETHAVKLRPAEAYLGTRPDGGQGDDYYYLRPPWRSLYSDRFETLLVKITCTDSTYGWGEALAPVAPEVPQAIVERLLTPALIGQDPRLV